jgi:hypothetical protein
MGLIEDIGDNSEAIAAKRTRGRRGKARLVFGIVLAVAGWLALSLVNNYAPDTAGLLGAHKVLANYGALHTAAIGIIIAGVALAVWGIVRMSGAGSGGPGG